MNWNDASEDKTTQKEYRVVIVNNGPYIVKGGLPINRVNVTYDREGTPLGYEVVENYPVKDVYSLCRCGKSGNRPFCDSTHLRFPFNGLETASRTPYHRAAKRLVGHNLILLDSESLCMGVGFCHRAEGTWTLSQFSDNPTKRKLAIEEAGCCPSGRLVVLDKNTEEPIEPDFKPSISLIDDSQSSINLPIWLKGGVPVESADGTEYETRFRVTLCTCGRSHNKPFCDGTHYNASPSYN